MVASLAVSTLAASSWGIEGMAGCRTTSIDGIVPEVSIAGTYDDFYFGLGAGGDDYLGVDLAWDYEAESSFRTSIGSSVSWHYAEGGLWTVYSDIGQDFRPFGWLDLRYRAGIQFGLSWADGVELCPWSLSPYAFWLIGYNDDVFSVGAYGAGMRRFEHTYQAPPVLGVEAGWNIDENHSVKVDAFMKLADYMEGPDLLITDTAVRIVYAYREGEV